MYNPRFPYKFKIKRYAEFESGVPMLDEDGKPSFSYVTIAKAVMFDGEPVRNADGTIQTENVSELEFGYRTSSRSTNANGDVVVGQRDLHTPLFLNEILYGDTIEMTDNERTYTATIVGKKNSNWGSTIHISEVNN